MADWWFGSTEHPSSYEAGRREASKVYSYSQQAKALQAPKPDYMKSGYELYTPQPVRDPTMSYRTWSNWMVENYGMSPDEWQRSTPEQQYQSYAQKQGIATQASEIPLGESGMPNRPPANPMEAALFQWWAGEQTRQKNEQLLQRAMSAYQYALGTLRKGGPGSIYEATHPLYGQMAQTLSTSQYEEPDFSFWLTPQAYGRGLG